jgi:hypothetical protein
VAIPQTMTRKTKRKSVRLSKKSVLEISDSIGIYVAFWRTLSDLHTREIGMDFIIDGEYLDSEDNRCSSKAI